MQVFKTPHKVQKQSSISEKMREYSKTKYKTNVVFQKKLREYSTNKYNTNDSFERKKYKTNEGYRQKVRKNLHCKTEVPRQRFSAEKERIWKRKISQETRTQRKSNAKQKETKTY